MDELLGLKNQTPPAEPEELSGCKEALGGMFRLTEREVFKNLKELGIFPIDKKSILESLEKMEAIIIRAPEARPLTDDDKSALMDELMSLSQNLPDIFYDEIRQLISEAVGFIKSDAPAAKPAKEGLSRRIKTLRGKIEEKS
jgi:hypothetical protein